MLLWIWPVELHDADLTAPYHLSKASFACSTTSCEALCDETSGCDAFTYKAAGVTVSPVLNTCQLKTLGAGDPELVLRFQREIEAQARVDRHPNVLRIHSAGADGGRGEEGRRHRRRRVEQKRSRNR